MSFFNKYIKYKNKYIALKKIILQNKTGGKQVIHWFWYNEENNEWTPYSDEISDKIDKAYGESIRTLKLDETRSINFFSDEKLNLPDNTEYYTDDPLKYKYIKDIPIERPAKSILANEDDLRDIKRNEEWRKKRMKKITQWFWRKDWFWIPYSKEINDKILEEEKDIFNIDKEHAINITDPGMQPYIQFEIAKPSNYTDIMNIETVPPAKPIPISKEEMREITIVRTEYQAKTESENNINKFIESIQRVESDENIISDALKGMKKCKVPIKFKLREVFNAIITNYIGIAFYEYNSFLLKLFYDTKLTDYTACDIEIYLEIKLLTFLIENCSLSFEVEVYRGIKDVITYEMRRSPEKFLKSPKDKLYEKLREYTGDDVKKQNDLLNLIDKYYQPAGCTDEKTKKETEDNIRKYFKNVKETDMWRITHEILTLYNAMPYESIKKKVGTEKNVIIFPSFTSTSISRKRIEYKKSAYMYVDEEGKVSECCLFKIIIPKNFPALYISGLKDEKEILLPPCTSYEVVKVESKGNFITLIPRDHKRIYSKICDFIFDLKIWLRLKKCKDSDKMPKELLEHYVREIKDNKCELRPIVSL